MRAIFFDLDGTLLEFVRPYEDVLADAFREVAGEVREEWVAAYDEPFFEALFACESNPTRRAFAAVDAGPEPDALADALLAAAVAATRPPDGAPADLARLAETYELGVLTNGVRAWQERKLRATGLHEYVDVFVASYEAGAHKPDPAPFRLAERRSSADEHAMVGDADADVDGASAVGWPAHRYDGGGFADLPRAVGWD